MRSNEKLNPKILRRVRGLLAKAESSQFAEEAAALTAKAQELMSRHSIEHLVDDADHGLKKITSRRLIIEAPYARNKFLLLSAVANANRCRAIGGCGDVGNLAAHLEFMRASNMGRNDRLITVFGYERDLDTVEMLFTSLLVQAVNMMLAHGSRPAHEYESTRSFRHAFIIGFAQIVGTRLAESTEETTAAASDEAGRNLLPVLANHEDRVDEHIQKKFPRLGTMRISYSSGDGYHAGAQAGRSANIGAGGLTGARASLPR